MKEKTSSVVALGICLLAIATVPVHAATVLTESFDSVPTALTNGWVINNLSTPVGTTNWFQGNLSLFPGQSAGYVAANFNNVASNGSVIDNWLFSPVVALGNSYTFSFYTRTESPVTFADRLQVMLSTSGASTAIGDFSSILDINPTFNTSAYPEAWTQQTINIALGAATTGRIAFRYRVDDTSVNGNYIGIDTVLLTDAATSAVPEPATFALTGAMLGVFALARRKNQKGAAQ